MWFMSWWRDAVCVRCQKEQVLCHGMQYTFQHSVSKFNCLNLIAIHCPNMLHLGCMKCCPMSQCFLVYMWHFCQKKQFFKDLNNKWDCFVFPPSPCKARRCVIKHPTLYNFEGAIELTKNTLKQSVILFFKKKIFDCKRAQIPWDHNQVCWSPERTRNLYFSSFLALQATGHWAVKSWWWCSWAPLLQEPWNLKPLLIKRLFSSRVMGVR